MPFLPLLQIDESVFFLVEFGPLCKHIRMRHCEVLQGSYIGIQDLKVRAHYCRGWSMMGGFAGEVLMRGSAVYGG